MDAGAAVRAVIPCRAARGATMDGRRFDELARGIWRTASRRDGLRIAAALLGWKLAGRSDASARTCRLVGESCGKDAKSRCCRGAVCNEGQVGGGLCSCPQNLTNCRGFCVDIRDNRLACGADCVVCPDDTDCCEGICCKDGQRCCGGACTDLSSDSLNCGGCTQECPAGLSCCDSRCRAFTDDPRHCGACRNRCGERQTCANGQCACRRGYTDCGDGVCRNLKTDPQNCGACGRVCVNGACRSGRCRCTSRRFREPCGPLEPDACGLRGDFVCERDDECCGGNCVAYGGQRRCRPCLGVPCSEDRQCCGGRTCVPTPGPGTTRSCGGCRGRRQDCTGNEQCCSSDCSPDAPGSTCLSNRDGRCASDFDCRECFLNGNCAGACVGGRCRV